MLTCSSNFQIKVLRVSIIIEAIAMVQLLAQRQRLLQPNIVGNPLSYLLDLHLFRLQTLHQFLEFALFEVVEGDVDVEPQQIEQGHTEQRQAESLRKAREC